MQLKSWGRNQVKDLTPKQVVMLNSMTMPFSYDVDVKSSCRVH